MRTQMKTVLSATLMVVALWAGRAYAQDKSLEDLFKNMPTTEGSGSNGQSGGSVPGSAEGTGSRKTGRR